MFGCAPPTTPAPAGPQKLPDWKGILSRSGDLWSRALQQADGPRILLATSVGGYLPGLIMESTLAAALTLRGARVQPLLCDECLPACFNADMLRFPDPERYARTGSASLCSDCYTSGASTYLALRLKPRRYREFLRAEDLNRARDLAASLSMDEIKDCVRDGVAVGEHALAGTLRYFARGDLSTEPLAEPVLRRYFEASLQTAAAVRKLVEQERPDSAIFHHGIYVPQGIVAETLRASHVRMVTWTVAYRKRRFIFSHGGTYHHTLMSEPVSAWEDVDLTPEMDEAVMEYLKSRWKGTRDWIWFHEKPQEEIDAIAAELGVDFSKPCIGLLTNVVWDAQLHYPANAFPNMLEWIKETIRYFGGRPEIQLLIRVHPAEIRGTLPSRQPVVEEIRRAFPELPKNVFVIPPESQVSTYAAMLQCDTVLIYGTKTGVELTSLGVPVVVGGEAWIRGKGVTMDAEDAAGYFRILDGLPLGKRLDEAQVRRARQYAFHFFFRRMMPLRFMAPQSGVPQYMVRLESLHDLLPGKDRALDIICDGILEGTPFIYPAETLGEDLLAD
jgi:hypothetical protein